MKTRGQTLVLFALTMLLVTLMVVMTLSIGAKAKDKLDLQASADAAAYSTAVATARAFNTGSLLGRTAISEWVAMAGIQALTAWGTTVGAYMDTLGEMAYDFQHAVPGKWCWMQDGITGGPLFDPQCVAGWAACQAGGKCPNDCQAESDDARAAAYEFWHAHYSLYSPGPPGDNINQHCVGDGQVCTVPRARMVPGFGQLDHQVALQEKSVWRAVNNLTWLEIETYYQLEKDVSRKTLAQRVLRSAQGLPAAGGTPAGYNVLGNVSGTDEAWDQISQRVTLNADPTNDKAYADATIGSIAWKFPTYMSQPPKQAMDFVRQIQLDLNQTRPGRFTISAGLNFQGCAFFSKNPQLGNDPTTGASLLSQYCSDNLSHEGMLGWNAAVAVAVDKVQLVYNDPCQHKRRVAPDPNVGAAIHQVGWVTSVISSGNSNQPGVTEHHSGMDDFASASPPGWVGGCHATHGYWNVILPSEHELGPAGGTEHVGGHGNDILPGGLAFIFPQYQKGVFPNGGAEAQPKLPILFAHDYSTGPREPWDLVANMDHGRFQIGGKQLAGRPAMQGALANGIAYYHRHGYWAEPANLLNPFWHATLVPADADHVAADNRDRTFQELQQDFPESAQLYRHFKRSAFKGIQ